MTFDAEILADQLNRVSLDLVMLSSDNLLELAGVLGQILAMEPSAGDLSEDPEPGRILEALEGLLRDIIRDRVPDRDSALGLAGDGLSLLQQMARNLAAGQKAEGDPQDLIEKIRSCVPAGTPSQPWTERVRAAAWETEPGQPPAGGAASGNTGLAAEEESGRERPPVFSPRKLSSPGSLIVPTPTHVRREAHLSQKLTVDYFKADFTAALEDLQMKLVTVEHKSDPVAAMSETIPMFRSILGGVSLLDLDDLARLTADTIGLLDYVSTEQVPH
ncbi:MAG: hypothetical protein LBK52_00520, partial [Deltaproteobacteria bacterium]|nr:hypothetical protein [Deltaproteobacteria bacterium]